MAETGLAEKGNIQTVSTASVISLVTKISNEVLIDSTKIESYTEKKIPRRQNPRKWTKSEVEAIHEATSNYIKEKNLIADHLTLKDFEIIAKNRRQSAEECMSKYFEVTKSGSFKAGVWPEIEDEILKELMIKKLTWSQIAKILNEKVHNSRPVRNAKQCKVHWNNHVDPCMLKGPWTEVEDTLLLETYKEHGKIWTKMYNVFPFRTQSSVKNRLKSLLNKCKLDVCNAKNLCGAIEQMIKVKKNKAMDFLEEIRFEKYDKSPCEFIDYCEDDKNSYYKEV
ncbi:hypothetical protein SteCoe_13632 [Stentor coeruleus]|uniref:Myb-like domain-containing protein n=1 Tax=Stentor coeruleus TaxID=5963 RepID=A0A1R2C7W2_9CILI|nr:hypothetical protein SteCoe_13632 [Stentor coeruleus]